MSRRKQGRPQQRRTIDSLEQENDLLVCGECQTDFPLYDILRFIEHKRNRCKDKENVDLLDKTEFDDGEDSETEAVSCISSKRTSISAPIARKESVESKATIRLSLDSIGSSKDESSPSKNHGKIDENQEENETKSERLPLRLRQVVDAESNTVHSEPLRFICEVCRATVNSAWSLLQHVQKEHGMKIYSSQPEVSASPKPLKEQKPSVLSNAQLQPQTQPQQRPLSQSQLLPQLQPQLQPSPVNQSHHHHHPSRSAQHTTPEQPLHRNLPSTGSMDLGPISHHQSPQFMFRLPFERQPLSSPVSLSPFSRPPGPDFRMDMPPVDPFHLHTSSVLGLPSAFETGPSPPFHNIFERTHLNLESQMDFYSQRLRQLASTTESPSPMRKPTPPFSQSSPIGSLFSTTPPAMSQLDVEKGQDHGSLTPPNKLKSCEFCGKSFRFQSNLIVHRRSHTGEKPFKCPQCPHACTQQSKLKRHMKTHMNKSPMSNMSQASNTSEGSLPSTSSTPDSNKPPYKLDDGVFADDDEMDDLEEGEEGEEEEEEEEELEDEMEEDEFDELEDMNDENHVCHMNQNEIKHKNGNGNHNCLPRSHSLNALDNNMSSRDQSHLSFSMSDLPEKTSVLSEVLEKSGLNSIQPYNEAFQQALAENINSSSQNSPSRPKEKVISKNGPGYDIKEESFKSGASQYDGSPDVVQDEDIEGGPMPKKIKNEPSELPVTTAFSSSMENWHTGLWVPPTAPRPDFFSLPPGFPPFDRDLNSNRYHCSHECNALKSLNAQKAGPSHGITNGTSSLRRCRSDTCEYCGKIFKNCSNLTVHRRSHTGEKPYKCELCNYACAQSSKLTRHMKTHGRIGKDVYRCKFCSMPFSVASTLEKHMRKCVEINPSHPSRSLMNESTDTDTDTTSKTASNL